MGKCLLFHSWGEWTREGTCLMTRTCTRCGSIEKKADHNFVPKGLDSNCVEIMECTKCHQLKEGETKHRWSEYEYYEDQCCTQISVCRNCGKTRYREDVHDEKSYRSPGKCEIITECVRCHNKVVSSDEHSWNNSIHTYLGCLEFVRGQISTRIANSEENLDLLRAPQSPNGGEAIRVRQKLRDEIAVLCLEQAEINAKIREIESGKVRNAPAKVCMHCLFISKTGRRVERIPRPNNKKTLH